MLKGKKGLLEVLTDSEVKTDLLSLFHKKPEIRDVSLGELAEKIGKKPEEIEADLREFVEVGLIEERRLYSFNALRDKEIQETVAQELRKRLEVYRAVKRLRTGVKIIDDSCPGGLPLSATVLVMGEGGTGKTLLLHQILAEALKAGRVGVYVCVDDFPESVRRSASLMGVDAKSLEERGRLVLVDCYSGQAKLKSREKHAVEEFNLQNLSITLSGLLSKDCHVVVLDSITTLLRVFGVQATTEFLGTFAVRVKAQGASNAFLKLNKEAFHPTVVASLQSIVDGVIETRRMETEKTPQYHLRILAMRGAEYSPAWKPYQLSLEKGLTEAA